MSCRIFTYKIPSSFEGHKLSEFLRSIRYSEKILAALRQDENSIKLNDRSVHMNHVITNEDSDTIKICLQEKEDTGNVLPVYIPLNIVYEDEDILIINKDYGLPIHPSRQNYEHTLGNAVAFYFKESNINCPFRCINRLDKDTSGLTIIAKNRISAAILYDEMINRRIYREYTAIVEGSLNGNGTISIPIGKEKSTDEKSIKRFADYEKGQKAVTHYISKPIISEKTDIPLSLVRLHLDTGRTHQIRVHMTEIGYPLIGDRLYNPQSKLMNRQALHAGLLSFAHPYTGEGLKFTAPLPPDMKEYV